MPAGFPAGAGAFDTGAAGITLRLLENGPEKMLPVTRRVDA